MTTITNWCMCMVNDGDVEESEELEVWTEQGAEHDVILAYIQKCGVKCGSSQCNNQVLLSMWGLTSQQAEDIRQFCASVFALERSAKNGN